MDERRPTHPGPGPVAPSAVPAAADADGATATATASSGGTQAAGWLLAMIGAAAFGIAGSFATPLIEAGWSPGAAVLLRVSIAGVVLLAPALWMLRGRWSLVASNWRLIISYGVVAVAACQLFYFNALETLTVGVALLLEYLGIIMVVLFVWVRYGQRPHRLTLLGAVLSLGGLVLVLDVVGGGAHINIIGALWGLAAAVGLATHFVLSAHGGHGLPPLVLAAGGLLTGAMILSLAGVIGLMPMNFSSHNVIMAGISAPWWVPILGLGIISAAIAYVAAIGSVRILGATLGSFVGLAEVLFAVLFAWLLLAQLPGYMQLVGGVLIVSGVALVRADEMRRQWREKAQVGL